MIPQDTVAQILDTARIEEVVSDYVALKRRGANLVACCPFHNEKTPSFYVSPAKGMFKCFGCGKSGSAVGFVMEQEHCSYAEALRYLARKYNIEVVEKEESAEEVARRQRNESLLLVSEFAQKFFAGSLKSGEGKDVGLAYFRKRGLEDETIGRFGLGWAPSGKTALTDAALAAGYRMEYLLGAGLAVQGEDGSVHDKFRERVMFPIHSVSGRVVAFSGRTLHADNPAKYVNSPETEIYVKSRNLLGIYFAKADISREDKCILVEGNVDMVMMHQLGIRNVVASCGTSLTVDQIRLIRKFTENVTIMYDGDSAGIHAALRGLGMVLAEGLNVRIVLLPEGDDPDSFCRRHTLEEVRRYIAEGEKDFIGFKTDLLLGEAGNDPLKRANLINDIADTIAQIPDPVKRSTYVTATSDKFGVESDIIFSRISASRQKKMTEIQVAAGREEARNTAQNASAEQPVSESVCLEENKVLAKAEKDLLVFLVRNGRDLLEFPEDSPLCAGDGEPVSVAEFIRGSVESDGTCFSNSIYRRIYDAYFELYDAGLEQDAIIRRIVDSEDREVADIVSGMSEYRYELTVKRFAESMTTKGSWLVTYVPKAILFYAERRVQYKIDCLRRSLSSASADQVEGMMRNLMKLQNAHRSIREKMGREIKNQ